MLKDYELRELRYYAKIPARRTGCTLARIKKELRLRVRASDAQQLEVYGYVFPERKFNENKKRTTPRVRHEGSPSPGPGGQVGSTPIGEHEHSALLEAIEALDVQVRRTAGIRF